MPDDRLASSLSRVRRAVSRARSRVGIAERTPLHRAYEERLLRSLDPEALPRHIGVIVDGNRRWAKAAGASTADGHRRGAAKIGELLRWCEELGIELVTIWLLSTDNFSRSPQELEALYEIICGVVEEHARAGYRVRVVGGPELLPPALHARIAEVVEAAVPTKDLVVNLAIGYGGRQEIVDAARSAVRDAVAAGADAASVAEAITIEAISQRLYTHDQADPDLIIRTSGEQRLSGFLLWQSVHSEYWFCETYWPTFRRTDLLRALRDYCRRDRRFGA